MLEFWLGLCAFFLALHIIVKWPDWFSTPEQKAWRRYEAWSARKLDAGATWDDIRDEREIRYHLAQLRETVSDHVARGGKADWEEVMKDEIKGSIAVLSTLDPALGKRFLDVVSRLHHSDILYPAEFRMVYPEVIQTPLTADQRSRWARTMDAAFTDL